MSNIIAQDETLADSLGARDCQKDKQWTFIPLEAPLLQPPMQVGHSDDHPVEYDRVHAGAQAEVPSEAATVGHVGASRVRDLVGVVPEDGFQLCLQKGEKC